MWQVKNFGRAGQTKYTHLLDQDTSKVRGKGWRLKRVGVLGLPKGRGVGTAEGVGAAGRGQVRGRTAGERSGPQGGR